MKKILNFEVTHNRNPFLNEIIGDGRVVSFLEDSVLLTYGFLTNFKDIPRTSTGAFKENVIIGNEEIAAASLQGQNAISVISALFDSYQAKYPDVFTDKKSDAIRSWVTALSKYIISLYSVSGGNNRFNEVYLPWYLKIDNSIQMVADEQDQNKFILKNKIIIHAKTKWFTFWHNRNSVGYHLVPNTFNKNKNTDKQISTEISKSYRVKTDYNYILQDLPDVIPTGNISKAFNPGGIDPKNPNELNYVLAMPYQDYLPTLVSTLPKIKFKCEYLYSGEAQKTSIQWEDMGSLPFLPKYFFLIKEEWWREHKGDLWNGPEYKWQNELLAIKLALYNEYADEFGLQHKSNYEDTVAGSFNKNIIKNTKYCYSSMGTDVCVNSYYDLPLPVRENNRYHTKEEIKNTYVKNPDALLIDHASLTHYYYKKIAENFGVSTYDFDIEIPTNLTFDDFEEIEESYVNVYADGDYTGAYWAYGMCDYLSRYIETSIHKEWPFAGTGYLGHPNWMSTYILGGAMGAAVDDAHQDTPAWKTINRFITRQNSYTKVNAISKMFPKRYRLKRLKIKWKHERLIGRTLKGDVIMSKQDWENRLLNVYHQSDPKVSPPISNHFSLKPKEGTQADKIVMFEFKGIWGDWIKINNINDGLIQNVKIEFPSRTDETITILRIAFL